MLAVGAICNERRAVRGEAWVGRSGASASASRKTSGWNLRRPRNPDKTVAPNAEAESAPISDELRVGSASRRRFGECGTRGSGEAEAREGKGREREGRSEGVPTGGVRSAGIDVVLGSASGARLVKEGDIRARVQRERATDESRGGKGCRTQVPAPQRRRSARGTTGHRPNLDLRKAFEGSLRDGAALMVPAAWHRRRIDLDPARGKGSRSARSGCRMHGARRARGCP